MFVYNVKNDNSQAFPISTNTVENSLLIEREVKRFEKSIDVSRLLTTLDSIDGSYHFWQLYARNGDKTNIIIEYGQVSASGKNIAHRIIPLVEAPFTIAKQLAEICAVEQFYLEGLAAISECRTRAMAWDDERGIGDGNFHNTLCYVYPEPDMMLRVAFNGMDNSFICELMYGKDTSNLDEYVSKITEPVNDYMSVLRRIRKVHNLAVDDLTICGR